MWFKGIVMEIKDEYAVVFKDDSTMVRVKLKDNMRVGDTLIFLDEDIYEKELKKTYKNKMIISLISIAAMLALVVLPLIKNNQLSPYALVSLDVNPSIQFELDKELKIVDIYGINKDASNLNLDEVKGLALDKGMEKLKIILEEANYNLKNDSAIVGFTFLDAGDDIAYEDDVKNIIGKTLNESKILYLKGNKADSDKAKEQGVSLGRYEAELNIDDDVEDVIEDMPVEEILKLLNNKSGIYLNEDVREELQDELEDRREEQYEDDDKDDEEDNEDEEDNN